MAMRIGLFTDQYYPSISGIVTSIKMLYDGLTALGHEVFIFTSFDEEKVDNADELNFRNDEKNHNKLPARRRKAPRKDGRCGE